MGNYFFLAQDNQVWRISEAGILNVVYAVTFAIEIMKVHQYNGLPVVAIGYEDEVVILTTSDSNACCDQSYEIKGIKAVDMTFLPNDRFALASNSEVQVLDVITRELLWQIEVENEIVSVFPGPNRDQIGILDSTGKITLHKFRE